MIIQTRQRHSKSNDKTDTPAPD